MTHADWMALLESTLQGGVPAIFITVVGWILRSGQKDLKAAQVEMHISMNSRLDELRKSDRALGHAEGMAQGRAEWQEKV